MQINVMSKIWIKNIIKLKEMMKVRKPNVPQFYSKFVTQPKNKTMLEF